jgi:hypothetical protein
MKLKALDAVAARTRSPINWFLGICLAAFLAIISASAAVPRPSAEELNAAEKWVVERVTAGEEADLSKQFPEEKDRKLSAHFLEDLLMGPLLHRHGVRITRAIIDEPIELENAQIPCEVGFLHCQFNKKVTFARATFAAGLMFAFSRFKEDANFDGMKVGGDASFSIAVFEGSVNFTGADIAGNFYATGAKFGRAIATFYRMKVGGNASFAGAVFEGQTSFAEADIAGDFGAEGAKFHIRASFGHVKVGGGGSFTRGSFEGAVDLRYAEFGSLDLSGASWPKVPAQFQIQGMSYKTILAAPREPESHEKLLKLVSQAAHSADVYSHLEEYFLRQGYRGDADQAFIAGKRRERKERLYGFGWLGSWLLDGLVCYGRRPWQAGIPCAVLVALGCVLFSPKKMEPQNPEDMPRVYNRFWYSLGLFLPFVDLQSNKVWKPKLIRLF